MKVKSLSRVRLFATPWTAAYQAPPPMGFSRQEYWSGVPLPSPSESLFSIKLIRNFITLIWTCVLQTSRSLPGSLLASTCYSAGNLCLRLWRRPALRSRPGTHTTTAQVAPPHPPSTPSKDFPGPQAPRRSKDCYAQTSVTRKEAGLVLG